MNETNAEKISGNADFRAGYAKGIMNASAVAMNMPLSEAWTGITERISDTTVQAMAWRTSMSILKKLPAETPPAIRYSLSEAEETVIECQKDLERIKEKIEQAKNLTTEKTS